MQPETAYAIPRASNWLLETAALLAPPSLRRAWKREWLWEIWHGHSTLLREGYPRPKAARRMARFALGAFRDAADLRIEHCRLTWDGRSLARNPFFCLAALFATLLALAGWTGSFRHSRAALSAAYPDAEQLVLLSRPLGVLGMQIPASSGQVSTWVESSKWFGDVAGFVLHDSTLEVTPNFFAVLHMEPAAHFRFLGHSVQAVKPLRFEQPGFALSGALVRLKHPQDRKAAEVHFARFLVSDGYRITATFLNDRSRWPVYFAGAWSLFFLGAGMLRSRRSLRYLAFFTAKTALLLGIVAAAWTEVATALPIPISGGIDLPTAAPLVFLLLLSQVFVMRWTMQDQAARCPVCCRLVSMPVTVGSRGSLLLDRPGIEFLCTRGHGTLTISDLNTCTGEPARWTPAADSWREVFVRAKTA
jgi:hypothetical protein